MVQGKITPTNIYTHKETYIHTCIHTQIHIHIYSDTHTNIHTYIQIYTDTHRHITQKHKDTNKHIDTQTSYIHKDIHRLALNSQRSFTCLCLPSAGIKGVNHQTWLNVQVNPPDEQLHHGENLEKQGLQDHYLCITLFL